MRPATVQQSDVRIFSVIFATTPLLLEGGGGGLFFVFAGDPALVAWLGFLCDLPQARGTEDVWELFVGRREQS